MKKQQTFSQLQWKPIRGGTKRNSHARTARSLPTKHWMHLVHKSERAAGPWSMHGYRVQADIKKIYYAKAKQYGVLNDKFSNNANHIHAKVKAQSRELLKKFLKAVGGMIARLITNARKGNPTGEFWTQSPYLAICETRAQVLNLDGYIEANKIEAVFGKRARETYLEWYREWIKTLRRRPTR